MKDWQLKTWEWLLFGISVFYLVYELSFNSRIVDGASGGFSDLKLEALEFQGRFLSGVGIALMGLRLVKAVSFKSLLYRATLTAFFLFSFMFLGQKWLVDYFVDASSEQARTDAMHIALLKQGMLMKSVQIKDIEISDLPEDEAGAKALLAVLGMMVFNSDSFVSHLKGSVDEIIDASAEQDARKTLPEAYSNYQTIQNSAITAWKDYQDSVEQYNLAKRNIDSEVRKRVDDIYLTAATEFQSAQIVIDEKEMIRKSLEIKRHVSDYYQAKAVAPQKCDGRTNSVQTCLLKIEQAYRDNVIKEAGQYVAPDYWCYDAKTERVAESIRGRMKMVERITQDCTSMDRSYIADKLALLLEGGESFLDSPAVNARVSAEVSSKGVLLPIGWSLKQRDVLISAMKATQLKALDEAFASESKENTGQVLSPTLTDQEFMSLDLIQSPLREAFNLPSQQVISMSLSPEAFLTQFHKQKYIDVYQEKRIDLSQRGEFFGDAEQHEQIGKAYYRSIIVPPVAMSFSLFFGILNLIAFVKVISKKLTHNPFVPWLASWGIVGITFIVSPAVFPSNIVNSQGYQYFRTQLDNDFPQPVGVFASWVIDAQPLVYPIGHILAGWVGQSYIETRLETYLHNTLPHDDSGDTQVAKNLDYDEDYSIPGLDDASAPVAEAAFEGNDLTASTSSQRVVTRINESDGQAHAYSIALLKRVMDTTDGAFIDIAPVGELRNEDWVIYDKSVYQNDICIPGLTYQTSLRKITNGQWFTGYHGACLSDLEVAPDYLPSLDRTLLAINTHGNYRSLVINIHESVTSEVNCGIYQRLFKKVFSSIGDERLVLSTPSVSVLGCFNQLPAHITLAFEMPMYAEQTDMMIAKSHKRMTMAEYRRIKRVQQGVKPTLRTVDIDNLTAMLEKHPQIDILFLDTFLAEPAVNITAERFGVSVVEFRGPMFTGEFK